MVSQQDINEIVKFFFTFQLTNKLYHWNTTSYARHNASDRFNSVLGDLIDKFIEVFIGRYKLKPLISSIKIESTYVDDNGIVILYEQAKKYLETFQIKFTDTDLLNIRDELLAEVNKTLYLFRLN